MFHPPPCRSPLLNPPPPLFILRWWHDYSDRKNDEGDEHVADSLLYDRNHLPRTAPAPDCVARAAAREGTAQPGTPAPEGGK